MLREKNIRKCVQYFILSCDTLQTLEDAMNIKIKLVAILLMVVATSVSAQQDEDRFYFFAGYKPHFPDRPGFVVGAGNKETGLLLSYGANRGNPERSPEYNPGSKLGRLTGNFSYSQSYSASMSYNRFPVCPYIGLSLVSSKWYETYYYSAGNVRYFLRAQSMDEQKLGAVVGIMTSPAIPIYFQIDYNTALRRTNIGAGISIKLPNL